MRISRQHRLDAVSAISARSTSWFPAARRWVTS